MLSVTLITVGKLKEKYYLAAAEEYAKRLKAYCSFQMLELPEYRLPEHPSPAQIADGLQRESVLVNERLPKGAWLCVLTPEGKMLSSESLAKTIDSVQLSGKSNLVFFIGSSYGMDASLKAKADLRLSMSPMTFPHHLARIMVLEQLYRAQSILAGSKYHK